jgi:choline-sulfatase
MLSRSCAAVVTLAAAVAASGCARAPARRPDVLLVTIDTLRADHCSTYGYGRPTTPALDALARRGVQFDVAYAPMATTAPSHATLFTGLLPAWHGLVKNGHAMGAGHRMLAEAFRDGGYRTGAVVSSFVLDRRFGLDRGFASYDDRFSGADPSLKTKKWRRMHVDQPFDRRADETAARAIAWLRENGYLGAERPAGHPPFLLWVHFFDPHDPYDAPDAHRARFPPLGALPLDAQVAAYDAEVHFTDEQLGALTGALAEAGALDRTVTVVTADHGEGLMQHGHMVHGLHLYEEAVRVPFVVHWPDRLGPRRVDRPVQLADVAPTLAEMAGVAWTARPGQGQSLAGVVSGRDTLDPAREVFLQRRQYERRAEGRRPVKGQKYALRSGRFKYIESREEGTFELYDLASDPGEQRNLLSAPPAEAATLPARLQRWVDAAPAHAQGPIDEETARKLRSLGYVQ